jgi:hypothetical protein
LEAKSLKPHAKSVYSDSATCQFLTSSPASGEGHHKLEIRVKTDLKEVIHKLLAIRWRSRIRDVQNTAACSTQVLVDAKRIIKTREADDKEDTETLLFGLPR